MVVLEVVQDWLVGEPSLDLSQLLELSAHLNVEVELGTDAVAGGRLASLQPRQGGGWLARISGSPTPVEEATGCGPAECVPFRLAHELAHIAFYDKRTVPHRRLGAGGRNLMTSAAEEDACDRIAAGMVVGARPALPADANEILEVSRDLRVPPAALVHALRLRGVQVSAAMALGSNVSEVVGLPTVFERASLLRLARGVDASDVLVVLAEQSASVAALSCHGASRRTTTAA